MSTLPLSTILNIYYTLYLWQSCEEYSLSDQEDTYLKKIQLFRLQVELFSLQIQLDSQRLQDEQQIHELGHLIAATNPYPVDGR